MFSIYTVEDYPRCAGDKDIRRKLIVNNSEEENMDGAYNSVFSCIVSDECKGDSCHGMTKVNPQIVLFHCVVNGEKDKRGRSGDTVRQPRGIMVRKHARTNGKHCCRILPPEPFPTVTTPVTGIRATAIHRMKRRKWLGN